MKELLKALERQILQVSDSGLQGTINIYIYKGHVQIGSPILSEPFLSTFDLKDYPEEEND